MNVFVFLAIIASSAISVTTSLEADDQCTTTPSDIVYYFYSLQNVDTPIEVLSTNTSAIKNTHFGGAKETIILVHGGGDSAKGLLVKVVKNDILNAKLDMNVIGLDWSALQKNNPGKNIYACAPKAGEIIANFLNVLVKDYGMKYSKLTFVGHSAAGPFCSAVGSALKGELKAIVGLDTSGIKKGDAKFVEYIHTTPGSTGAAAGDADYYPNGGSNQTGCSDWGCNHWRAIAYYAESVTSNKFVAKKCDTYENYKAGKCSSNPSAVLGRLELDTKASGKYFLETNGQSPYAKG